LGLGFDATHETLDPGLNFVRRREALATIGKSSLALFFAAGWRGDGTAAERKLMATPDFVGKFTANNPGIMTLQGTNQYVVGRENVIVIDVALSADSNLDGIIEQVEAMGAKKIDKILLTHIHSDHCGGALALRKRCGAKLGIHRSRKGYLGGEDFQYDDNDRISFGDGELNVLLRQGLASGSRLAHIAEAAQEQEAIAAAFRDLKPGDLLVIGVEAIEQALRWVRSHIQTEDAAPQTPPERG